MRTTLTLDPDVSELLEKETHRQQKPFKQVVNEALRKGLTQSVRPQHRVRVVGYHSELRPGFDAARFNALADELEDAVLLRVGDHGSPVKYKGSSRKARRQ